MSKPGHYSPYWKAVLRVEGEQLGRPSLLEPSKQEAPGESQTLLPASWGEGWLSHLRGASVGRS